MEVVHQTNEEESSSSKEGGELVERKRVEKRDRKPPSSPTGE